MKRLIDSIKQYGEKFKSVPINFHERISFLLEKKKFKDKDIVKLQEKIDTIKYNLSYNAFDFTVFLVPKPSPRPRMVFNSRRCYVEGAAENMSLFKKYLESLKDKRPDLIVTPCEVTIKYYMPIPEDMNKYETVLAELGLIRPVIVPDVDNVAKSYIDMTQKHLLLNDSLIYRSLIDKYYSAKPRIEITFKYMNVFESRYTKRKVESWKYYKDMKEEKTIESLI